MDRASNFTNVEAVSEAHLQALKTVAAQMTELYLEMVRLNLVLTSLPTANPCVVRMKDDDQEM